MNTAKCLNCPTVANYICSCGANICKSHRDEHEAKVGVHSITLLKVINRKPDLSAMKSILDKLQMIEDETIVKRLQIIEASDKAIIQIANQAKTMLLNLRNFLKVCEEIRRQIITMDCIPNQEFYPPLENALLGNDVESFLTYFQSPSIEILPIATIFNYIPTIFPQNLYNYSDIGAAGFPKLFVCSLNKTIEIRKCYNFSRCLDVGNNHLMFTGGQLENEDSSGEVFILDVSTETIVELPKINYSRNGHAMTWIDGCPAVIGGKCKSTYLSSVEVLQDKAWVEISSINIPRYGLSAVRNHEAVWIAGGYYGNYLDSIEMYNDSQWKLLQIKLPRPDSGFGLICMENSLFLFGGFKAENSSDAYWIGSPIKWKNLEMPFTTGSNQHCINPSKISVIGWISKKNIGHLTLDLKKLQYFSS